MTATLARARTATPALLALVAATGLTLAVALWSFIGALARVIGAVTITAESISQGYQVPAAAVDGTSTGTLSVGLMEVTQNYDGNNVPLEYAYAYAAELRGIIVPFEVSALLDALLVLSLSVVVLLLCLRLLRGRPFLPHVTVSLAVFAGLTAVLGIGSQLVRNAPFAVTDQFGLRDHLALVMSAMRAPEIDGISWGNDITYIPVSGSTPLDLTMLGMAVLLGLIAAAFAIGQRMQRDVEGLV
jgi:hypothetical protein